MLYLSSIISCFTSTLLMLSSVVMHPFMDSTVKIVILVCARKIKWPMPVALLVAVIMPAIASDMSALLRRLTSFQNPQKPPWSRHCIVCVIAAVAYTNLY